MTIHEIEEMIEDTKRLPRISDKVALSTALASLEIARQLIFLNEHLAGSDASFKSKSAASGKKK